MNVRYLLVKSLARLILLAIPLVFVIWAWKFRTPVGYGGTATWSNPFGYATHASWHLGPLPRTTHIEGAVAELVGFVLAAFAVLIGVVALSIWIINVAFDRQWCDECETGYRYGCPEHQPELRETNQRKAYR